MLTDHEENGTESLNWWWSNSEKADTQFSEPRVHCLEERSKGKEVENYLYTSVPMVIRLKLFHTILLISSVSTEQSQICVMSTGSAKQERGDPCWQDNLTHCSSQQSKSVDDNTCTFDWSSYTRRSIAEVQGTSGKTSTTRLEWSKCVLMQDSWQQLKSDSTSWQRTLTSSYNLQSQWHVVSTFYQEMKNHLTRKVGFEGTLRLDPCWKSQPATYKVIMEWK